MPIISRIRKRSPSLKAQVTFVYIVLIIGAATMIYPFMIMIAGSFKSAVDSTEFDLVPKYFYDDAELFRKYEEARYDESILFFNRVTGLGAMSFAELEVPKKPSLALVKEWESFQATTRMPLGFYQLEQSWSLGGKFMPLLQREFAAYAASRFKGDIGAYNRAFNDTTTAWFYVKIPVEQFAEKGYASDNSYFQRFFKAFKSGRPRIHRIYLPVSNMYRYGFLNLKYGMIENYNRTHGTTCNSYSDITVRETAPSAGIMRDDWLDFVRNNLNRVFIEAAPSAIGVYRQMLKVKYGGDISRLSKAYGDDYRSFGEVDFPVDRSVTGAPLVDFNLFVTSAKPEYLRIIGPDTLFKKYLIDKYGSVGKINRALGTSFSSSASITPPNLDTDWEFLKSNEKAVRWEFISRNYKMVLNFILLHGRGIFNTVVFCLLSVAIALTITPLAAYALSRYNLPSTYKILFLMMATMAFPAVVTMIPNFLLLKQLHLLNTFWALVLPGVASGYTVFLLKGFFDSLPRELYEAAMIDGASEWTMFWRISMALSQPILAVIALGAFAGAYGAFMFAFVVCQDQKMWTLMVWLFKLQQDSHMAVTYAALIIAAIPTLVVFSLSQNVIMRGIIVPQEK